MRKKSGRGQPPRAAEDRPEGEKIQQLAARLGCTTAELHRALWTLDLLVVPSSVEVRR